MTYARSSVVSESEAVRMAKEKLNSGQLQTSLKEDLRMLSIPQMK